MSKKLRSIVMALALLALVAATAAFALSPRPKIKWHRTGVPRMLHTHTAQPAPGRVSHQDEGDGNHESIDGHEGNENDSEDHDGLLTAAITPEQAKAAAVAAQPGMAGKAELEDENGVTVYAVEVTAADGAKYDVKVDANTGRVLKSEPGGADEDRNGEGEHETNDERQ